MRASRFILGLSFASEAFKILTCHVIVHARNRIKHEVVSDKHVVNSVTDSLGSSKHRLDKGDQIHGVPHVECEMRDNNNDDGDGREDNQWEKY